MTGFADEEPRPVMDVIATLNYLSPHSGPAAYLSGEPGEEERPTGEYVPVPVRVQDARALDRAPELEIEGLCLFEHGTEDVDFASEVEIIEHYYPQVADLLRRGLGAQQVVVFDHNVRVDADRSGIRRPARHVHSDYTARSAIRRAVDLVDGEDALRILRGRFAQVNFWRPIHHPVETSPLAVADARSIAPEDYVKVDIIYPGRSGEILEVTHRPDHRWLYFPGMTPTEALVFKGFDSAPPGGCRWTPHSAFNDPTAREGGRPRTSIELRALIIY
jgi:hypothetical protein